MIVLRQYSNTSRNMRPFPYLLSLLIVSIFPVFYCHAQAASPSFERCPANFSANEDEVLQVNFEYQRAILSGDTTVLDKLFQNDAKIIHGNGAVQDKEAFLDSIRDGNLRFLKYDRSQVEVHVAGCTAWITALTNKLQTHSSATLQARALMILVHQNDGWKIALFQNTEIR